MSAIYLARRHPLRLFFPLYRSVYILVPFVPHQTVAVVACGEAFVLLPFVLKDAAEEIPGDSDVERVAAAGHDVCAIAAFVHVVIVGRRRDQRCDRKYNRRSFVPFAVLRVLRMTL